MGVRSRTNPGILVPWVHWNLSSARVLTMEFVDGVTLSAATALARRGRIDELADLLPGVDLGSIVRRVADESLRQVLVDGLFHADPHPGNIIVCRDGTIAYVDFGSFGRLTRRQRQDCSGYISQNALGNYERGFRHFFRLMLPTADVDYRSFKRSSIEVIRVWSERSQEAQASPVERHLGTVMLRTMAAMRLHGVRPAPEFLLFWRVLFQVDSMALEMGDSVDMFAIVREFFEDSGHTSWYHIDGSAHRVPVDAGADAPRRRPWRRPRRGVASADAARRDADVVASGSVRQDAQDADADVRHRLRRLRRAARWSHQVSRTARPATPQLTTAAARRASRRRRRRRLGRAAGSSR